MSRHPSRDFRRWCAGLIALVFSGSLPGAVEARVAPMELVKFQLKKPNFLIVVESAESMQGLPGENPARYNEVGADCENGDRFCRLYGQAGRCEFSGMGKQGYVFDYVPMGTATGTSTKTGGTKLVTESATGTSSANTTAIASSSSTTPAATTVVNTTTGTFTVSTVGTATETKTPTSTRTVATTNTQNTTDTATVLGTGTNTSNTTATSSITATSSNTATTTNTQTYSAPTTSTVTVTPTSTFTAARSFTETLSIVSASATSSNTETAQPTSTHSETSTSTQTVQPTSSYTATSTNTQTLNSTHSQSGTNTSTVSITPTSSYSASTTSTATVPPTSTLNATSTSSHTNTNTQSYSAMSTATITLSTTNTWTAMPGGHEKAFWKFEGSGASLVADAWGTYNGTSYNLTGTTGRVGQAAQLGSGSSPSSSTTSASIYMTSNAPAPTGNFAIGFWVSPNKANAKQTIISYDGGQKDGSGSGLRFGWTTSGNNFCLDNNNGTSYCEVNAVPGENVWSYVLITAVSNVWTWRIYTSNCNSPKTSGTLTMSSFATGGLWRIGAGPGQSATSAGNATNQFLGKLDEVRIWDSGTFSTNADAVATSECYSGQEGNLFQVWTVTNAISKKTSSAFDTMTAWATSTASAMSTQGTTIYQTSTSAQNDTSTVSETKARWATATLSQLMTNYASQTLSTTATQFLTGTQTGTLSRWATMTLSETKSQALTSTLAGSASSNNTATSPNTMSANRTITMTGTEITPSTGLAAVISSSTGTVTESGTAPSISSYTDVTTTTQVLFGTRSQTATATTTLAIHPVPDTEDCDSNSCAGNSYCYLQSSKTCSSNSDCTTSGDFCRQIGLFDGSQRVVADFCSTLNPPDKICRYQDQTCLSDSVCQAGTSGLDYCVTGHPAHMCRKSGLWCSVAGNGTQCLTSDDICGPATSRMMMVKNAVRRVVLDHAYDDTAVVKIGQMHTYQANRQGSTDYLFPYVKLSEPTVQHDETKFLPRSELMRGLGSDGKPCFSGSAKPSDTCTIDYGGGGASSTPSIVYHLLTAVDKNDSRYAIPTGDGKTFIHVDNKWDTCGLSCAFPSASTPGTGFFEGSYYTFSYRTGVPIDPGSDPNNPAVGSLNNPQYSSTYRGKSYGSAGNYWMLMDAERSDIVNENKYGAQGFSGASWSSSAEYGLPYVGASGDPLSTSVACSSSNGAQWDRNLVPMANATTFGPSNLPVSPTGKALLNVARLEKNSFGGFHAVGNLAPVACALKNDGANDSQHSVEGYMNVVRSGDPAACYENHVLLVVDGLPRGPGDLALGGNDCSAAACLYTPNTNNEDLNGCNCPAVIKARNLAKSGINVHVIAATTDRTSVNTYAANTLNNIARAGSTKPDFVNIPRYAATEDELYFWLNYEMKEALRVRVATTPASAASGTQSFSGVTNGQMLYQTVAELPEWRGSLVGYAITGSADTSTSTATGTSTSTSVTYTTSRKWDAARRNGWVPCVSTTSNPCTVPNDNDWKLRKVFFSDGSGAVRKISVDSSGSVDSDSKTALLAMGMGANANETERIVQWMLGKLDPSETTNPRPLNPAVMGSVVNSMPLPVGAPGISTQLGSQRFYSANVGRPELVYVGADDGMLHAFYAGDGGEAFAFIPADMVPVIAKLYAQGGQRYNPSEHIYGLSGSPKAKNLCVANCNPPASATCSEVLSGTYDSVCPVWKTILIMGEGQGGNHPFALDITNPISSNAPDLTNSLLWHVGYKGAGGLPASELGDTMSVAAFAYKKTTDKSDNRVLMASSYPAGSHSYTKLIDAKVTDGSTSGGAGLQMSGSGCTQDFGMVADVALARDYTTAGEMSLVAAYLADTHGKVHQYAPFFSSAPDSVMSLGCDHPLHFSPAVVQLNRNDPNNINGTSVFLAQVTNSLLDPATRTSSTPSKLVVKKLTSIGFSPPGADATFGTSGEIHLSAGTSCTGTNCLCGVATNKTSTTEGCGTGGQTLPSEARPTGTPVAVIRSDGAGFQLFTTWYKPPTSNWNNCQSDDSNGSSYITVHEFLANGTWIQIAGIPIQHQYVTGVQFLGTTLFVTYGMNDTPPGPPPNWPNVGQTFSSVNQIMQTLASDRFIRTAWAERLDM